MHLSLTQYIKRYKNVAWIMLAIFAFFFGWLISGGDSGRQEPQSPLAESGQVSIWTCSMHPQIRQPGPGKCPICGMDLIPLKSDQHADSQDRQIVLSDYAQHLAAIQVSPVERKFVSKLIRLVGKIDYDESQLKFITARVPGRIDRMYVDYTGVPVKKGEHLVELYSPDLVSTQQELIQTWSSLQKSDSPQMRQNLIAVQERLRLWGMTQAQIDRIENSGSVSDHMTIYAPISGVVIQKEGVEGVYVETGSRIYTVADLSRVWLRMAAYESDISWIRYGQRVKFETEAYAGEQFDGKIAFIDPVLNETTRTVNVRVNVKNDDGRLKPGMFVHAVIESEVAAGGKVINSELSGKWICSMHPDVVRDGPGKCDVCGMPLVKAENLGYLRIGDGNKEASLVIPATAPLITGKRAVVYVRLPGEKGRFEGREIVLGPRVGDYYIVLKGLQEGEQVVVNGNFKIDSAVQILAGPSMMNPEGGTAPTGHQHSYPDKKTGSTGQMPPKPGQQLKIKPPFSTAITKIYKTYFGLQYALSHDNRVEAVALAESLHNQLHNSAMPDLTKTAMQVWMTQMQQLQQGAENIISSSEIGEARAGFLQLSQALIILARHFDSGFDQPIYLYFCPMAFENQGAEWLQNKDGTENPYFGSQMFTCGTQKEILTGAETAGSGEHPHE